jgi:hypothetical protein
VESSQEEFERRVMQAMGDATLHGRGIADLVYAGATGHEPSSDPAVDMDRLWSSLKRLEWIGWVESEWAATPSGQRTKYYRLSAAGRRRLGSAVA